MEKGVERLLPGRRRAPRELASARRSSRPRRAASSTRVSAHGERPPPAPLPPPRVLPTPALPQMPARLPELREKSNQLLESTPRMRKISPTPVPMLSIHRHKNFAPPQSFQEAGRRRNDAENLEVKMSIMVDIFDLVLRGFLLLVIVRCAAVAASPAGAPHVPGSPPPPPPPTLSPSPS